MQKLRTCLVALTAALEHRAAHDTIYLDGLTVHVDSRLDDAEARRSPAGHVVPPPDGLFEWAIRRDFVRALPAGPFKRRLGETLGGPKTRRRFELLLDATRESSMRDSFQRFRRRRLRSYAARVLRFFAYGNARPRPSIVT